MRQFARAKDPLLAIRLLKNVQTGKCLKHRCDVPFFNGTFIGDMLKVRKLCDSMQQYFVGQLESISLSNEVSFTHGKKLS